MFIVTLDLKNELTATPIIWAKKSESETGYYWPLYGLHFKLKNYVPLPIQSETLKNEWRYVSCKILLNGENFNTYLDAETAILKILKEAKGSTALGYARVNTMESNEVETNEKQSNNVELVEQESDEDDENFENFPLKEVKDFNVNEIFLKTKSGMNQLEFYLQINEKSERKFFNKCVRLTFRDNFFLETITFKKNKKKKKNEKGWVGVFNETRLYKCLKKAMIKKFKFNSLDETELKEKFVKNFARIKRAIRA